MILHANEKIYRFGLILSVSICVMAMRSDASEPGYDQLFSYRYTALTGFELSEDGVRQALEQFDDLILSHKVPTIAVVGEQNYQSLTPYLKDIYNRRSEQAPGKPVAYNRDNPHSRLLDRYRITVARSLVRCGDPEGERFAIEQALNSPNMGRAASEYSIRTLKYIVHHFGTDVSAELEFLIEVGSDVEPPILAYRAARELVEIQRYLQLKSDPQESIYSASIERLKNSGDSRLRRTFERHADEARPSWRESLKLISINAQESDLSGR